MIRKRLKGSLTIETAIIFPLIVFGIIFIILLILLVFCRVNTSISINKICNEISGTYYDVEGKFGSGNDPTSGVIIEAVSETLFSRERKRQTIEEQINEQIQKSSPLKLNVSAEVEVNNCIIWQGVDINVKVEYPLILGGVFEMFTNDSRFSGGKFIETYKRSIVVSSTENNIRSMDYLGDKIDESGIIDDIVNTIKSKIGSIFGF